MIILHQFPPYFDLPNASPPCMKVETYLRLANIEYQAAHLVGDLRKTPRAQAPYITDDGVDIPDSELIISYLKEKFGDPLGEGLSEKDRAYHAAIRHMLEDHQYFIMLAERWTVRDNAAILRESFFHAVPAIMRKMIFKMAQKGQVKRLAGHGMGKFTRKERQVMGRKVADHLSAILAEDPYFGGDKAREIDCIAFASIAGSMLEDFESPLPAYFCSKPNLVAYKERMMKELFPDFSEDKKS